MTGGTVTILYARASIIIIISIFYIAGGAEHTSIYPGGTGNRGRCGGRHFTRFFLNTKTGLTCFFSYRNADLRRRKTMKKTSGKHLCNEKKILLFAVLFCFTKKRRKSTSNSFNVHINGKIRYNRHNHIKLYSSGGKSLAPIPRGCTYAFYALFPRMKKARKTARKNRFRSRTQPVFCRIKKPPHTATVFM